MWLVWSLMLLISGIFSGMGLLHFLIMKKMAKKTAKLGCWFGFHSDYYHKPDRAYTMECPHCKMTWMKISEP